MTWRKMKEKNRKAAVAVVMIMEHYLLLPPSLYLLGVAWYLAYMVGDTLNLIEGVDIYPLPILLFFLGVLNFLSNWRILKCAGSVYWLSRRQKALESVCLPLIFLLITTLLVFAASLYCFIQLARLPTLFEEGLNKSMRQYISNTDIKARLDLLQIDYSCCGDQGYKDWFHTPWVPTDKLVGDPKELQLHLQLNANNKDYEYVNDDVPFSCCLPSSPRPCVHHHVATDYLHYRYHNADNVTLHRQGCRQALQRFVGFALLCPLALSLLFMACVQTAILVVCRVTFTSMQTAIDQRDMTGTAEGYIIPPKKKGPGGKNSKKNARGQSFFKRLRGSFQDPEEEDDHNLLMSETDDPREGGASTPYDGYSYNDDYESVSSPGPYKSEHHHAHPLPSTLTFEEHSGRGAGGQPIYENIVPESSDDNNSVPFSYDAQLPFNEHPGAYGGPQPRSPVLFPSEMEEGYGGSSGGGQGYHHSQYSQNCGASYPPPEERSARRKSSRGYETLGVLS